MKDDDRSNGHKNCHHIFPTSRFPGLAFVRWNKVMVNPAKHQIYHWLFNNSTPMEITQKLKAFFPGYIAIIAVYFLNSEYWGDIFEISTRRGRIQRISLRPDYRKEYAEKVRSGHSLQPI